MMVCTFGSYFQAFGLGMLTAFGLVALFQFRRWRKARRASK